MCIYKYLNIDRVIVILAVYHCILELRLNNQNTDFQLYYEGIYIPNQVNGVQVTALFTLEIRFRSLSLCSEKVHPVGSASCEQI